MAQKLVNKILFGVLVILIAILAYKVINPVSNNISSPVVTTMEEATAPEDEKEKVQDIVKEYLMNNPEVIIESIEQLQKRKMQEMEATVKNYIEQKKPEIENSTTFPVLGNAEGDIIIVSFYDYNCSYCKKGDSYINQALEANNDVKVILRPFPILGENSMYAAKIALAVHKLAPAKFKIIHQGLMHMKPITAEAVEELISSNEIDWISLQTEIHKPEIQSLIDKNFEMAGNLRIQGVPAYIINGKLFPGLVDFTQLQSSIAEIRSKLPQK